MLVMDEASSLGCFGRIRGPPTRRIEQDVAVNAALRTRSSVSTLQEVLIGQNGGPDFSSITGSCVYLSWSIFAASTKSFSVKPLALCVQIWIFTSP